MVILIRSAKDNNQAPDSIPFHSIPFIIPNAGALLEGTSINLPAMSYKPGDMMNVKSKQDSTNTSFSSG